LGVIPVFVISLERDSERRAAVASRLNALDISPTLLKAVDGRALAPAELERAAPRRKRLYHRPLSANEIACGLSHLAAIAEGVRADCDFFCVLEDDVIPATELPDGLVRDTLAALPEFDVLRLFTHLDRWDKPSRIVGEIHDRVVVRMLRPGWGCQGQIYSRRGAAKILAAMTCLRAPFDYALYHDCHVAGLKVLELRPGMVVRDFAKESSIGRRDRAEEPKTPRERLARNLLRTRRKFFAAVSFFRAWGAGEFLAFLRLWR
jgi:GR25 family glycosyltransferase involved in LPS biosynthesis